MLWEPDYTLRMYLPNWAKLHNMGSPQEYRVGQIVPDTNSLFRLPSDLQSKMPSGDATWVNNTADKINALPGLSVGKDTPVKARPFKGCP